MKQNFLYIVLISLLALVSCTREDNNDIEGINDKSIVLKFSIPENKNTKATTEDGEDNLNENRVKTLDVFIYQENGNPCIFYQHIDLSPEITGTGEYSKVLSATQDQFQTNVKYSIRVVANYTGVIPADGLSFSELRSLTVSSLDTDKKQDYFIMDGVTSTILNDGVVIDKTIPVTLKRAAAKIRVGMSYANGFSLADNAAITKRVINYSSNSTVIDERIFLPTLQSMSSFTNQDSGAGNTNNIIVYSYANDWNDNINNETYLIVNVPVKNTQGEVLLQNYYKVPVNFRLPSGTNPTSEETKALYKIQRNYLYDITVLVDKAGSTTPETAVTLDANYVVMDWTTKDVIVAVEGLNFLFVRDSHITLPNNTSFTTLFQSSTPDVQITDIKVNDTPISNGSNGVNISWTANAKYGSIVINSTLPTNFFEKDITFTVRNGIGLTQQVTVSQFPPLFLSSDISADEPGGSQGQDNNKMYIITSLVADFSNLKDPDEFDEDFGSGYTHYAPNPELGASYAKYIRENAVLGYPQTDANGATLDTPENNRRISPRYMLASQHGTTTASDYNSSKAKCIVYVENDETTGETYSDWRMPTLAEIYMIDILQNTRASEVKKILEGNYYWSARGSGAVNFMDPRVGGNAFTQYHASVRCVRDVKN